MNALKIQIRSKKSDSAYLYHTFEANEGLAAYHTLPHQEGADHRDMELVFSPDAEDDVRALIAELQEMMWVEILSQ